MDIQTEHILAYIEGRLSKEETKAFEQKMQQTPELRKEVDDLRFIYDTSDILFKQEHTDIEKRWKQVSLTMKYKKYRKGLTLFLRYAAAILFIPLLIASLYLYQEQKKWANSPKERIELTSAYGLVSKVTLPDGSEVWLNSGSKLHYPSRFENNRRTVSLLGEAYFKVSADKNHRFDVELPNGLTVSAYGTEFNINAYDDDEQIRTTLATGSVEIKSSNLPDSQILYPGEQASYNKVTGNMQTEEANLYMTTSWKDGKLVFRRTGMAEIAKCLSRHFNVNIILKSKQVHNYTYSATFTTETLEEILKLLKKTAPIKCTTVEPEQTNDYSYTRKTIFIEAR